MIHGEVADQLRAAARHQGFTEREVFSFERANSGPWNELLAAAQSLSLFSSRRLLEVRLPGGKPGTQGAAVLQQLVQLCGPDLLLIVLTGELDRDAKGSAWFNAIDSKGVWVEAVTVPLRALPAWIKARGEALQLSLDDAAVGLLATRCEGNLLAAQQELLKLSLQGIQQVNADAVLTSLSDSSRYDVAQLGEALLNQDLPRALRVMAALRSEGVEATLVLWSLVNELRVLWFELVPGPRLPQVWSRNTDAVRRVAPAFRGRGRGFFGRMTVAAARLDRIAKGQQAGQFWDELALWITDFVQGKPLLLRPNFKRMT